MFDVSVVYVVIVIRIFMMSFLDVEGFVGGIIVCVCLSEGGVRNCRVRSFFL